MAESTRLQTAKAYISTFANLDTTLLSSLLAPSYVYIPAPASLGDFLRTKDKDEMVAHIASLRTYMTGFPVYAKNYWESDAENMVTVWATSKIEWKEEVMGETAGTGEWEFEGEYMFLIWMDKTEEKVVKVLAFMDSLKTVRVMELMGRAREKMAVAERSLALFNLYLRGRHNYSSLFRDNLTWMTAATVFVALVLTAMQVGLATERLQGNPAFQRASYGFTIFAILGSLCAFCLVVLNALFHLVKELPSLLRGQRGRTVCSTRQKNFLPVLQYV
ncbi:hypothetical protein DL771_003153 [Monosporascus sp. 5C6A]|nr:hypothetical protein DL771_003153 [Monosporascus sp. 5C6A]